MTDHFIHAINALCSEAYANSKAKGFHEPYDIVEGMYVDDVLSPSDQDILRNHLDQACMARVAGEIGEAVEAMRHGNPESEKIPGHSHVAEELADTLIRIFDFAGMKGWDLGGAVMAKLAYTQSRPHLHGKNS